MLVSCGASRQIRRSSSSVNISSIRSGPSFVSATRLGQVFIQADACVARRRGQPEPLHYTDPGPFLEVVAERLRGIEVLGDGIVIRVVRQTAAEFFRAPILARAGGSGKVSLTR